MISVFRIVSSILNRSVRKLIVATLAPTLFAASTVSAQQNGLTIDDYSRQLERNLFPRPKPFSAVFESGASQVEFIATVHDTDPRGASFREVDRAFADWKPKRMVVEGFPSSLGVSPSKVINLFVSSASSENSYVKGEEGRAVADAIRQRVPFWGGDLTDEGLFDALRRAGFSALETSYIYLLGPLSQDFRAGLFKAGSYSGGRASFVRWAATLPAEHGPKPTWHGFLGWYRAAYSVNFLADPHWTERFVPGAVGPAGALALNMDRLRNRHLLMEIRRLSSPGGRLLVVYGGGHAVAIWRSLIELYGRPIILPAARDQA